MKKLLSNIFMLLFISVNAFALEVKENTETSLYNQIKQGGGESLVNWDLVILIVGIGLVVVIIGGIIWWIIAKIIKKIRENNRKGEDIIFEKYINDIRMCQFNSDSKYRHRNPWTFFLTFKKAKMYADTSDGLRFVGHYDGEAVKKEGYFIMGLEMRHSFFKRETDVIIMPYDMRKVIVKKNDDKTIYLKSEGVDETMSSEFYSMPVLHNELKDKYHDTFVDFSNDILENYLKIYNYRRNITNLIQESRDQVKEAIEMNSGVQYGRKTSSNLKE